MTSVPVLSVDEKIHKATTVVANNCDRILLEVSPPEQGEGMDVAPELLRDTLHLYDTEKTGLLSSKNVSPLCGMELWYDDRQAKFVFSVPNEDMEKHYRQQISGYYDGCTIQKLTESEGKFIQTNNPDTHNEAIAISRMQLQNHYFMPVAAPNASQNEIDSDPFRRILNQIDTKDDSRVLIQTMFKPAPNDWTENQASNLETYSAKIEKQGGVKTRFFGFKVDEVQDAGIYESAATEIRNRLNEPAFFVNIRIAVVASGDSQETAETNARKKAKALVSVFKNVYRSRAGQGFTPVNFRINKQQKLKRELTRMTNREGDYMEQPMSLGFVWRRLKPTTDTIIMTADELAGVVHLPSTDEVDSDAVDWTDRPVSGSVPPTADRFEPVQGEERERLMDEGDIPEYADDEEAKFTEEIDEEEDDESTEEETKPPSALFDNE